MGFLANGFNALRRTKATLRILQVVAPFVVWWFVHVAFGVGYRSLPVPASAAFSEFVGMLVALGAFLAVRWIMHGATVFFFVPCVLAASLAFPSASIAILVFERKFDALGPAATLLFSDSQPGVLWLPASMRAFAYGADLSWGLLAVVGLALMTFCSVQPYLYEDLDEYLKVTFGSRVPLWSMILLGGAACAASETLPWLGGVWHLVAAGVAVFAALRFPGFAQRAFGAIARVPGHLAPGRKGTTAAGRPAPGAAPTASPASAPAPAAAAVVRPAAGARSFEAASAPPPRPVGRFESVSSDGHVEPAAAGGGPPPPFVVSRTGAVEGAGPGTGDHVDVGSQGLGSGGVTGMVRGDEGMREGPAHDGSPPEGRYDGVAKAWYDDPDEEPDDAQVDYSSLEGSGDEEDEPRPASQGGSFPGVSLSPGPATPPFDVVKQARWTERVVSALLNAPSHSLFIRLCDTIEDIPPSSRADFASRSRACAAALLAFESHPDDQAAALSLIMREMSPAGRTVVEAICPSAPVARAPKAGGPLEASLDAASSVGTVVRARSMVERALDRSSEGDAGRRHVPASPSPLADPPSSPPLEKVPSVTPKIFIPPPRARLEPQIPRPPRPSETREAGGRQVDDEVIVITPLEERNLGMGAVHREPMPRPPAAPTVLAEVRASPAGAEPQLVSDLELLAASPAVKVEELASLLDPMLHLAQRSLTSFATDFVNQANAIRLDGPAGDWVRTTRSIWGVCGVSDPSEQLSILLGVIDAAEQLVPDKRLARAKLAMFASGVYRKTMDGFVDGVIGSADDPSFTVDKAEASEAVRYLGRVAELFPSEVHGRRAEHFGKTLADLARRQAAYPAGGATTSSSQAGHLFAGVAMVAEAKFSNQTKRLLAQFDAMADFFDVVERQIALDCMQSDIDRSSHGMTALHDDLVARGAGVLAALKGRGAEIAKEVGQFLERANSVRREDPVVFVMNLNRRSSRALYAAASVADPALSLNVGERLVEALRSIDSLTQRCGALERAARESVGERAQEGWAAGSGDPFQALSERIEARLGLDEDEVRRFPFAPLTERRFRFDSTSGPGGRSAWRIASTRSGPCRLFVFTAQAGNERSRTVLFPVSGGGLRWDLVNANGSLVFLSADAPWAAIDLRELLEAIRPVLVDVQASDFKFLLFNGELEMESKATLSSSLRPDAVHTAVETGMVVVRADLDRDDPSIGYASGFKARLAAFLLESETSPEEDAA